MAKYDKQGREIPDNRPVEVPIGYKRSVPLEVQIRAMVDTALYRQAVSGKDAELETPDQADDFSVPGEVDQELDLPISRAERAYLASQELAEEDARMRDQAVQIKEQKRELQGVQERVRRRRRVPGPRGGRGQGEPPQDAS